MTKRNKNKVLLSAVTVLTLSGAIGLGSLTMPKVNATDNATLTLSDNGVLLYNADEFTITEDYAPVVNPSIMGNALDPNGEMKVRLDEGKSGMLLTSKQTGRDAVGDTVHFANEMQGDFSLDFRVFSQTSAVNMAQIVGGNALVWDGDTTNTYLDLRRVAITIQSVSNPDVAFTVYVYGGQCYAYSYETIASVQIEGETYTPFDGNSRGYGLYYGDSYDQNGVVKDYSYNTPLLGTSFCNSNMRDYETQSTTIKFDPETMCVYGVNKVLSGTAGVGANYKETDVLIRNLATNANEVGTVQTGTGLATLNAEDFEGGYTTSIRVDHMTSDDTALPSGATYARHANMVIYNVNGQDLRKYEDWTVEENTNKMFKFDDASGVNQVSSTTQMEYTTAVKYGDEAGSTRFYNTQDAEGTILLANPFYRYMTKDVTYKVNVYLDDADTANGYTLMLYNDWTWKKEWPLTSGTWNEISFTGSELGFTSTWANEFKNIRFILKDGTGDWTLRAGDSLYLSSMSYTNTVNEKVTYNSVVRITSDAKNLNAEGNSFALNTTNYKETDGTYILGLTAQSQKYEPSKKATQEKVASYYSASGKLGLGNDTYENDPYSDVRELGITVRSTTDPTQSFTVYLSSRSWARVRSTARVYIEGEAYRNDSGDKGFSNGSTTAIRNQGAVSGSMGLSGNTDSMSGIYDQFSDVASYIKFDPVNMTVYGYAYGWKVIRNLTDQRIWYYGDTANADEYVKTLSSADFVDASGNGTFTMELFVSKMNTEWNKGLTNTYNLESWVQTAQSTGYAQETGATGNSILASGYDRKCIIDIYSGRLNETQTIDKTAVDVENPENQNEDGYRVAYEWTNMRALTDVEKSAEITLSAPSIVSLFNTSAYTGNVTYSAVGKDDSGVIAFANGVGKFSPKYLGEYVLSANGVSKTIKVGLVCTWTDGENEYQGFETDGVLSLADYQAPVKAGKVFLGWQIDGKDGIYSSEYSLDMQESVAFTAKYIDFAMKEGASIRLNTTNPGLRFTATISESDYSLLDELTNVSFAYTITGNLNSVTKPVDSENIYYNETKGEYRFLAAIVGIDQTRYAMKFNGVAKMTYTTADNQTLTVNAVANDNERCIQEVAVLALADEEYPYSDTQIEILEKFANIPYASTLSLKNSTANHIQGIANDGKYLYYSYTDGIMKQDMATGETVSVMTGFASSNHTSDCEWYDGKLYVSITKYITYAELDTEESRTRANLFMLVIDTDKMVGNIDVNDTDIVKVIYLGLPIIEWANKNGYDENGNELSEEYLGLGGWLGINNNFNSIAFGPKIGGADDGKMYLTATLGACNSTVTVNDQHNYDLVDRDYYPIIQYDISTWSEDWFYTYEEMRTLDDSVFVGPTEIVGMSFYECGAHDYGIETICYDAFSNSWLIEIYPYYGDRYSNYRGYILDAENLVWEEIPYSGGVEGWVFKEKCGILGKGGEYGYVYSEGNGWYFGGGVGCTALGDGYYYVALHSRDENGLSDCTCVLYRWNINAENQWTAETPFERIEEAK